MDASGAAVMRIYVFVLFIGWHGRAVACTVTSHQEDCGFNSNLCGVRMFSQCLRGFCTGTQTSSHSAKTLKLG